MSSTVCVMCRVVCRVEQSGARQIRGQALPCTGTWSTLFIYSYSIMEFKPKDASKVTPSGLMVAMTTA